MDIEKLSDDLAASQRHFIMTLRGVPAEVLNVKPAPEKWSPGEIAEHVALVEERSLAVASGPGKPAEGYDVDKRIALLRGIFTDQDKKYIAPAQVEPTAGPKDREALVARIQATRSGLIEAVKTLDLTETATAFAHPAFGEITRVEWIYAVVFHTERHRLQIEAITRKSV